MALQWPRGDALVMVPVKGAIERDVSDARVLPEPKFIAPTRLVAGGSGDSDLDAEAGGVAALLFGIGAQFGEFRLGGAVGRVGQHHPSVTPFRDTPERQVMIPIRSAPAALSAAD
jgi:hypothetical protein